MNALVRDLWHDLREKRLWPVAAALLLAVVAVPALLLESGSGDGGAAAPPVAATVPGTPAAQQPVVELADQTAGGASRLGSFDEKDPFKPRGSAAPEEASEALPPAAPAAGGDASGSNTPASGDSPLAPSPSGGSGDASGGGSSPIFPTPAKDPEPTLYTYEIDVRFGRRGKERTRRSIDRMEPLPNKERPLLLFLGTSSTGRSAVFLLDRTLQQRGEGICKPSKSECSLLYLRKSEDRDLHFFTDVDGRDYALRLLDIKLVPVKDVEKKNAAESRRARANRRRTGKREPRWPFDSAAFADLVK